MDSIANIEVNTVNTIETNGRNDEDYVVKCIGKFGLWQAGACTIASLTRFVSMWNMLSILFLTPATNFKCAKFESNLIVNVENSTCYDNCEQYEIYNDVFDETLITEFGLICENAWKASFSQSILMFGLLVGVFLFGWISDRYGRRKALLSSAFINVIFMLIVSLSPNYWVLISLRFLIGMASGGTLTIGVVYILEIVGPQYRAPAGALALLPDGLAQALLSAFAYYSSTWRIYSVEYAVVSLIFVIPMILLPESPRWLVSKGQVNNAVYVLTRIAKFNKKDISRIENIVKNADGYITTKIITKQIYLDFLKSKWNLIAIMIIWTSAGACYFGINQYITFVENDLLMTVIFLGLIQVPICPLAVVLNKLLKRKTATILCLLTTEISMIGLVFLTQKHWACTYLGLLGFAANSGLFNVIYVYTGELFPTSIRSMAYGLGTAGAKVGAMVVPFIVTLIPYWIPSTIFAAIVLTSMVFCFYLPETKSIKLQDYA